MILGKFAGVKEGGFGKDYGLAGLYGRKLPGAGRINNLVGLIAGLAKIAFWV